MKIFGLIALGTLLACASAAAQQQAANTVKVADGIYSYGPGDGYISMFVVTSDGVVAVEPVNTKHAKGMLKAIRSVTRKPVRYLIHTHNHWDHSSGGQVFRDAGAKILAHKEAFQWMQANPGRDTVLPDEGWNGKRKDIKLGGKTIELHYIGMSHGLGMTVIRVAQQKVIYIADIVTPKRVLFTIVPDFNIKEWLRALSEIEKLDFDKAIFSHTEDSAPFGGKADVVESREFIQDLQAAIIAEFKKGTHFARIPQIVKLPKYKNWAMYKEWLPMNVWRVMLDMWMGPFPWRPALDFEK
ncbi:MAG: MBL fold metallo-hydrolase [SAR324 cluster bacterium]|nr:MBL fold metallo-hydrolase [SAR324 cluster bacterium]